MNTLYHEMPILQIEVKNLAQSFTTALRLHREAITEIVQKEVDRICTPKNLEQIISVKASKIIHDVIHEELSNFYTHGKGRQIIRATVLNTLNKSQEGDN